MTKEIGANNIRNVGKKIEFVNRLTEILFHPIPLLALEMYRIELELKELIEKQALEYYKTHKSRESNRYK